MSRRVVLFVALFSLQAYGLPDPLAQSAEYYYSHYHYQQAYNLWSEVFKRQPENGQAVVRLAELKLMFEGRPAARDLLLQFLAGPGRGAAIEWRPAVKEKLARLASTFLTNDGQSLYAQAVVKARRSDCAGAGPLLGQAAALEKGNLRVLREKAACEKALQNWAPWYETLKLAVQENPFNAEVVEHLAEGHLYYKDPAKAVDLLGADSELTKSPRALTTYSIALLDTGEKPEALAHLQQLIERDKSAVIHPIVSFGLGKILAGRPATSVEAASYLERFLAVAQGTACEREGWDPYRCAERREEAQKLLEGLRRAAKP